jgi:hypothetical protein
MTIARAQMYRQLYQLGGSPTGIATMPMDFGQSLQVNNQAQGQAPLMSQAPNYSSATSITSNPLLNYGQPELGQAGGTPLTMRSGGRIGYEEGGMGMMQDQAMVQSQMQQAPQMDPKQALELIIQMLVTQGIPEEQAREIAIQMVQAVAEGGMGEMDEERVEARFGGRIGYASGGIGSLVNREKYGFGSFISAPFKAAGKLVKGAVNAVKKVAKSDLGKAALTVAAIYASGGGFSPQGFSMFGSSAGPGLLGGSGAFDLGSSVVGQGLFGAPTAFAPGTSEIASLGSKGLLGNLGVTSGFGADLFSGGISSLLPSKSTLLTSALGGVLGGALGGAPVRENYGSDEEYEQAVAQWKTTLQSRLDQPNPQFQLGLFPNNPFYAQGRANGGRIGYGFGSLVKASGVVEPVSGGTTTISGSGLSGLFGGLINKLIQQNPGLISPVQSTPAATSGNGVADLIKETTKKTYFENMKPLYNYDLEDLYNLRKENNDYMYANGGRIGYALGAEVPTRENQAGVQELDYRQTGGFVPPIGIKEKADDIPAMLSNNEFVFTANAVRNAGGGNVNKGAERMYSLMKNLENGGRV